VRRAVLSADRETWTCAAHGRMVFRRVVRTDSSGYSCEWIEHVIPTKDLMFTATGTTPRGPVTVIDWRRTALDGRRPTPRREWATGYGLSGLIVTRCAPKGCRVALHVQEALRERTGGVILNGS
jgi:hypothetical protein